MNGIFKLAFGWFAICAVLSIAFMVFVIWVIVKLMYFFGVI